MALLVRCAAEAARALSTEDDRHARRGRLTWSEHVTIVTRTRIVYRGGNCEGLSLTPDDAVRYRQGRTIGYKT